MDYYQELFIKIEELIKQEQYEQAKKVVEEELSISYIPREDEKKLNEYYLFLKEKTYKAEVLTDDKIEEYLKSTKEKQLLAVDALDNKNLRDYYDLCEKYLMSNGFDNAKVLMIDSLIKQEINHVFVCLKGDEKITFNPSFIKPIEVSNEFAYGSKLLYDYYMKEPSKTVLAKQLLYKHMILYYPLTYTTDEIKDVVEQIKEYINKAFDSAK